MKAPALRLLCGQSAGRFPIIRSGDFFLDRRIIGPVLHLLPLLLRNQELARLRALKRTDDPAFLHFVDDSRGAGIAELQAPLEHGNGRLSGLQNDLNCGGQQLVTLLRLGGAAIGAAGGFSAALLRALLDLFHDLFGIIALGARLDRVDDRLDLLV